MMDQPDGAGSNAGPTPPELFAMSLAGCIGHYVAAYCNQVGVSTEGLKTTCNWRMSRSPYRIGVVHVEIHLPGLPVKRRKAIERVAASCLIHATLTHPPEITISINESNNGDRK
jgi:uncharacterized OsmC-like protein